MASVLQTVERLRAVKRAAERFIALWALDCLLDESRVVEKLAADLHGPEQDSSDDCAWTMNS
jgi:hypothetical protein